MVEEVPMIKKWSVFLGVIAAVCLMGGCSSQSSTFGHTNTTEAPSTQGVQYESMLGIIDAVDTDLKTIRVSAVNESFETEFVYYGYTTVYSRFGSAMTVSQLNPGDIVSITYSGKAASEIRIAGDKGLWENLKVTSFTVKDTDRSFKIGQTLYYYDDRTRVYSNGERIDIAELCSEDRLIVRGCDNRIVSVVVERGHGYVTLENAKYFYGGYIDFGGEIIKVVEENMLITVPEGSYRVEAVNGAYRSEKYVEIVRGENTVIDYSDVMPIVTNYGNVKFNINADDAVLYIDGIETDYSSVVSLVCGNHTIRVEATDYDVYTKRIEVGIDYLVVNVSLVKGEMSTETVKGESNVTSSDKVTVKADTGSLVYFDSTCKGIAPVTFDMITGSHTITVIGTEGIKSYNVTFTAGEDVVLDYTAK